MTADSGSGQAPSNAKYLLLLVVVVMAPVIFTWFTTSPGKSDADFDRLLNAGKTYYDSGEAQKAATQKSASIIREVWTMPSRAARPFLPGGFALARAASFSPAAKTA